MQVLTTEETRALTDLATSSAHQRGLELLRLGIRGTRSRPVLEVILDGERQVSIEDCEVVSKALQAHLDEKIGAETNYRLDVLSPGTDEPLIQPYQYKRSIGRKIEVQLEDGSKTGRLKGVSDSGIMLAIEPKKKTKSEPAEELSIPFTEVRKAKVLVEL
jgi:ribosome maturation factor RimP